MKNTATKIGDDSYQISSGAVLKREFDSLTPNGNPLAGRWALRDQAGSLIDFDRYINDLAERNAIDL